MHYPEVFQEALQYAAHLWSQQMIWAFHDGTLRSFEDALVRVSMAAALAQAGDTGQRQPNIYHEHDGSVTHYLKEALKAAGMDNMLPHKSWTKITYHEQGVTVAYRFGLYEKAAVKVFHFPTPERKLKALALAVEAEAGAKAAVECRRIDHLFVRRWMRVQTSKACRLRLVNDRLLHDMYRAISRTQSEPLRSFTYMVDCLKNPNLNIHW